MKNTLSNLQSSVLELTKKVPLQIIVFSQTLLIVILIVLLPLILITLRKDKNNNSKASITGGTATISLSPATSSLVPNTRQNLDILVNTGQEKIDGVQAILAFSGSIPTDITFAPATVTGLTPIVNLLESTTAGKKLSLAFITNNPLQPFTTSSALVKIGTISFTVPASGSMTTTFDSNLTTAVKNGTSEDVLSTPEPNTYTFASGPGLPVASGPSLSFDTLTPPNPQVVGSNFEVNIIANTATQKVSGVDAQVSFDPKLVEIVSVAKSANTPFLSFPELNFDNTTGKVYISANIGTAANPTPVSGSNVQIAKIVGKTKAATSSTTLQFVFNPNDRNDSNMVLFLEQKGQEPADILSKVQGQELIAVNKTNTPTLAPISPTAGPTFTLTPSPTATFTPSATPTLTPAAPVVNTVQFSLQGKNRDDANKTAQLDVSLKSVAKNTTATNTVTTNTTGQVQLSAVPDDYVLLVKAPGYLARKIGSVAAPVRLGGTTVNLTANPLLGGDFNNDGEVNEIDYTLNFLTSFRSSNSVVDLDSSGNVNNLDFAIMRSNWALQSDTLQ